MSGPVYAWCSRSLTELDQCDTITLCRRTDGDGSDDLILEVQSTQDRQRLYARDLNTELPHGLDYEEVAVGDPYVSELHLDVIQLGIEETVRPGWLLERLWGDP